MRKPVGLDACVILENWSHTHQATVHINNDVPCIVATCAFEQGIEKRMPEKNDLSYVHHVWPTNQIRFPDKFDKTCVHDNYQH
jgi:hypothetical protein